MHHIIFNIIISGYIIYLDKLSVISLYKNTNEYITPLVYFIMICWAYLIDKYTFSPHIYLIYIRGPRIYHNI